MFELWLGAVIVVPTVYQQKMMDDQGRGLSLKQKSPSVILKGLL